MSILTGTLWRPRHEGPASWGNITDRPASAADIHNSRVKIMGVIRPGDTVLVVSERRKFSDDFPHVEAVQVLTPAVGWCNAAYFVKDSIWFERVA